jgi:hypothetical protein
MLSLPSKFDTSDYKIVMPPNTLGYINTKANYEEDP